MQGELVSGHALFGNGVGDQPLGQRSSFDPGQHPPHGVAAVDVQDHVEVVVGPLLRTVQLGDVPRPHRIRCGGDELGLLVGRVGGLTSSFTNLIVLVEDPVHGRDRPQVDPLVEQLGVDGGRCLVDELVGLEECLDLLALDRAEGPGLGRGDPLGSQRFRALAVSAIPGGPIYSDRNQGCLRPHDGEQLVDRIVDHLDSPLSAVLSVASCSNSAESFPWISTTCLDLSRSPVSRSTLAFKRTISRSRGSAFWRPADRARASPPCVRCWRQVVMSEEYRPSRRSSAPRAALSRPSYSARILALYLAENCRRPEERSGTSGSGGALSSSAPACRRVSSRCSIVVVMGEFLLRPQFIDSGARSVSLEVDTEGNPTDNKDLEAAGKAGHPEWPKRKSAMQRTGSKR